jgi:hypothetical protein
MGAVLAGYYSGHYAGVRETRIKTQQFLRDFTRSTDLEPYLEQQGKEEWIGKLAVYGIGGLTSYVHSHASARNAILAGIACVAVGIGGLLAFSRKPREKSSTLIPPPPPPL